MAATGDAKVYDRSIPLAELGLFRSLDPEEAVEGEAMHGGIGNALSSILVPFRRLVVWTSPTPKMLHAI